jgi:hypothetical protein
MTLVTTRAQALAEYAGVLANSIRYAAENVMGGVMRLFRFASDHIIIVAIVVAIFGFLLLRPRHTPR